MPYVQSTLALDAAPPAPGKFPTIPATYTGWSATTRHTPTASGRHLPADLWNEYRLECESRERLHLPDVSFVEFRDMRDWTDTIEEINHDDHRNNDTPPYGCHP